MPRRVSIPTAGEFRLLEILWRLGEGTIEDFVRASEKGSALNYKIAQTVLRIMEEKGLVAHHVEGRTFVYTPCFSRDESAVRFLDRVFDGAASELVQSLLRRERIRPEELERLHGLIGEARRRRARKEK